jgi:hypothetical protein
MQLHCLHDFLELSRKLYLGEVKFQALEGP